MTMSEALMDIAPNTTRKFSLWLMESYGMSIKEFENARSKRKYYEVSKFFGYPLDKDTFLSVDQIIAFIKDKFTSYEEILIKYPDGVPNFLKQLKDYSHEKKTKWLEENFTRAINISLCHALIKGNRHIRISLKDALIERQLTVLERASKFELDKQVAEQQFWNDTIKNFIKDEIAPF